VKPRRINRLLIANRGEIACRIAATARRLNMTSLAVYSDADRNARHVRMADAAFHLGAAPAAASYLNIERIIAVAREAGADAVHPGYGFLSENAGFAQACLDAGLLFIGPPPSAILAMGSKSASKAAMAAAGVQVAPGYHGAGQSPELLAAEAQKLGYPLIVKASAGGGGKGMQIVASDAELPQALESAQRLARTAFGDDRLLFERYFPRARHVEVQILADTHGNVLSLFDRDCSIQRRHQKIIEEAPAPGLSAGVRAAMAEAAVTAARAVDYVGAGTIEFLVDDAEFFYFMEMNTRLQVEHPVTELITDLDLVEWQLRVAEGEALPAALKNRTVRGAAIEARLYAEDPARGYLPSVGHIAHLRWPDAAPGLRLDVGVDAGDDVSPFYDPMLGKIIAWGETREDARRRLSAALAALEIVGVATNRALLAGILADADFKAAHIATDFLQRRRDYLAMTEPAPIAEDLALAAFWYATRDTRDAALWDDSRGWRMAGASGTRQRFGERLVSIEPIAPDAYRARVEAAEFIIRPVARNGEALTVELAGRVLRLIVIEQRGELHLFRGGAAVTLRAACTEDALDVEGGEVEGSLLTPLPGTVVAVHVGAGDEVARGAALITVEAMKMEHTLTAPYAGTVVRIHFGVSERVAAGAALVELKRPASPPPPPAADSP
jgi:3-methylcrotonyl-CoA carboxylase alpha subunit